jgi:hypothetical protein
MARPHYKFLQKKKKKKKKKTKNKKRSGSFSIHHNSLTFLSLCNQLWRLSTCFSVLPPFTLSRLFCMCSAKQTKHSITLLSSSWAPYKFFFFFKFLLTLLIFLSRSLGAPTATPFLCLRILLHFYLTFITFNLFML